MNRKFDSFVCLGTKKTDDSRIKHLKESVIEKRGNVHRAHNDYIIKLREYQFIDQQYVHKIRNLLIYHESVELILNKSWSVIFLIFFIYKNLIK